MTIMPAKISLGVYLTERSIYWEALRAKAAVPEHMVVEVENPLRPVKGGGLSDGAALMLLKEKMQTILAATKAEVVVVSQPNMGMMNAKSGFGLGCNFAVVTLAALEMNVKCLTKTASQANSLIRPGTHYGGKEAGGLEVLLQKEFSEAGDQSIKCLIAAWAGLLE